MLGLERNIELRNLTLVFAMVCAGCSSASKVTETAQDDARPAELSPSTVATIRPISDANVAATAARRPDYSDDGRNDDDDSRYSAPNRNSVQRLPRPEQYAPYQNRGSQAPDYVSPRRGEDARYLAQNNNSDQDDWRPRQKARQQARPENSYGRASHDDDDRNDRGYEDDRYRTAPPARQRSNDDDYPPPSRNRPRLDERYEQSPRQPSGSDLYYERPTAPQREYESAYRSSKPSYDDSYDAPRPRRRMDSQSAAQPPRWENDEPADAPAYRPSTNEVRVPREKYYEARVRPDSYRSEPTYADPDSLPPSAPRYGYKPSLSRPREDYRYYEAADPSYDDEYDAARPRRPLKTAKAPPSRPVPTRSEDEEQDEPLPPRAKGYGNAKSKSSRANPYDDDDFATNNDRASREPIREARVRSNKPGAADEYADTDADTARMLVMEQGRAIERRDRSTIAAPMKPAYQNVPPVAESMPTQTNPAYTQPDQPDPPGPNPAIAAVASRAEQHARHALDLARRGAFYSARAELIQSLRLISQGLDAQRGGQRHSQKLSVGLKALEEADDFSPQGARLEADLHIRGILATHKTPVLKGADPDTLLPVAAMQTYYAFAQQQIAESCGHEPAASLALFGLGKLYTAMVDQPGQFSALSGPKALAFHQAALAVDNSNYRAANEMGVLLAKYGQLPAARVALLQSIAVYPMVETWQNLAVVHERLGEGALAEQARNEHRIALAQVQRGQPLYTPDVPVQWLSPDEFARTSPRAADNWPPVAAGQGMVPGGGQPPSGQYPTARSMVFPGNPQAR